MNNEWTAPQLAEIIEKIDPFTVYQGARLLDAANELRRQHTALQDLQTECTALRVNEENLTAQVESLRAQLAARGMDFRPAISRVVDLAHRKGELWERCQGKCWPAHESDEFTKLRDDKLPSAIAQLQHAMLSAAPTPQPSSRLSLAVIGHRHFGNPIPQAWYAAAQDLLADAGVSSQQAPVAQGEPIGYMNAGHIHELQQGRSPYGYVYQKAETGASVAVFTTPQQASEPMTSEELWPIVSTARVELFDLAQKWSDNKIHSYQFAAQAEQIVGTAMRDAERHHQIKGKQ
jgi:hypothetical protein